MRNSIRQQYMGPHYESLHHTWFNVLEKDKPSMDGIQTNPQKKASSFVCRQGKPRPEATMVEMPTHGEARPGDTSILLRLPRELRDMVYSDKLICHERPQAFSSLFLGTALLLVNKQIRAEAAAVLYSENTFKVCIRSEVESRIKCKYWWEYNCFRVSEDGANLIRRIRIANRCLSDYRCVCAPLPGVRNRRSIAYAIDVARAFFKDLKIVELRPQLGNSSATPQVEAVERHVQVMSEAALGVMWNCSVQTIVFTEAEINYYKYCVDSIG
ncbi:hypothetical protein PG996_006181 [Apiospora saccharicola]|uniref:Uncharacterized protein n=1 Tax=Apiospora saccharicola TaxID=335842 RepID=A0ABR1VNR0_9PEZI